MMDYDEYDMEAVAMSAPCGRDKKKEAMSPAEKKAKHKKQISYMLEDFERFASQITKCKGMTAKEKGPILRAVGTIRAHMGDAYAK